MVVDEYTLMSWAQNPYYDALSSLEPLRVVLRSKRACCGQNVPIGRLAFTAVHDSPKFYDDMQTMRGILGETVLTVRICNASMTVAA